jgi:hypothetical protein
MRLGASPNEPSSLMTRPAALFAPKGFSEQINSSSSKISFRNKKLEKNALKMGSLPAVQAGPSKERKQVSKQDTPSRVEVLLSCLKKMIFYFSRRELVAG